MYGRYGIYGERRSAGHYWQSEAGEAGVPAADVPSAPSPPFEQAACRAPGIDPDWFFPQRGDQPSQTRQAKQICLVCPERDACREWAVSAPIWLAGVWGGTTGRDRVRLRRSRRVLVPQPAVGDDRSMAAVEIAAPSTNGHTTPVELSSKLESSSADRSRLRS